MLECSNSGSLRVKLAHQGKAKAISPKPGLVNTVSDASVEYFIRNTCSNERKLLRRNSCSTENTVHFTFKFKIRQVLTEKKKMLLFCSLAFFVWGAYGAPISWKLVDMSYTFDETTQNWPGFKPFEMKVIENGTTEDGYWIQIEEYSSAIHAGTHMDAPCHFALGKWCVDDIPLERLSGPAAVIDITDKAEADADAMVDIDDLKQWEQISERSLDGTIVVMKSGWGRRWHNRTAFIGTSDNDEKKMHFPGMSPEAAQWLVDNRDIYGVISETLSIDQGPSRDFMSHRILYGANIYGLEMAANVEELPIVGAFIYVSPMKIGKGSGAPTRIIAKYPKVVYKPKVMSYH